jgi:hypothetical protein
LIIRLTAAAILNIILLVFIGCGDDPSSIGTDLIKDDRLNILEKDSFTDSLRQSSSYLKRVSALGRSDRNLLGKNANIESSILLKFLIGLHDTLEADFLEDSINIVSAKITLTQVYFFGDSSAPFDFSVHDITSGWSAVTFTSDSLNKLTYDPADVSSNRNFVNNDSLEFNIDNLLILNWLKAKADTNAADDNGIYIKPSENTQKVLGFYSYNNSEINLIPGLKIIIEKRGNQDTLLFLAYASVSAVSGFLPAVTSENIVVQNSLEIQSKLWFDVSSIPSTAKINHAELTLTLDTLEAIKGSSYTKSVRVYFLTDSLNNALDSLHGATLSASGNQYKGDITYFVQNWINGSDNQGLLFVSAILGEGVELLSFKGSNSADALVRPRLKIVYTIK